jgi:tetratricopeptide (TPR) repeat protein
MTRAGDTGFGWQDAVAALHAGHVDRAYAIARDAVRAAPASADALHVLGLAALRRGDPQVAAGALREAARLARRDADIQVNLGLATLECGDARAAAGAFRRALALAPARADAHRGLGDAVSAAGETRDAIAAYRRAERLDPQDGATRHNLGLALRAIGRLDEAAQAFRCAAERLAEPVASLVNLGTVLEELGRNAEAVEILERVASRADVSAMALVSYGNACVGVRRHADAEAAYRRAHAGDPARVEPLNNLGGLLKILGRYDEALACFEAAVATAPRHANARVNRALAMLARGRLAEAWPDYEWRVAARTGADYLADPWMPARTLPRPSTRLPIDLRGQRLLVLPDQGLGDEIFFLRFARGLRERGAHVACLPSAKIASIVARAGCVDEVVDAPGTRDAFDIALAVAELPLLAGTASFAAVPPPLPLVPLAAQRDEAARRLAGEGPVLGVTWRAGAERLFGELGSLQKEVAPEALGAALAAWPGRFAILQRAPRAGEIARFEAASGRAAIDLSGANDDLELMLGLLAGVAAYAGPSNTNTHLFHGLGRAAHVLVPNPPEWRWLERGAASPWFPGARLYRQDVSGAWDDALHTLGHALGAAPH